MTTVLPDRPPRGRRIPLGAIAAVLVLVAVTAVALLRLSSGRLEVVTAAGQRSSTFVAHPLAGGGAACTTDPSTARDDQGRQYLLALQAAEPSWDAVTASLQREGGDVHRDDVVAQAAADRLFLAGLTAHPFTGSALTPAAHLVATLQAYITLLDTGASQPGYLAAHPDDAGRLDEDRAEASAALRRSLALPASTCDVLRP